MKNCTWSSVSGQNHPTGYWGFSHSSTACLFRQMPKLSEVHIPFGEFDKTEEHNKIKDMDKNLRLFNLNCKTKLPHKYLVNMVLGDHLLWLLGFVGRDPSPFKTTQIKNSDKLGAKKKRKSANVFTLILNLGENNEFGFWCGRSVTGEVVYITEHFIQATEGKEDNV